MGKYRRVLPGYANTSEPGYLCGIDSVIYLLLYEVTGRSGKIAENLGKSGTYIPGIRPGTETKDYINKVLNRITVLGAIGLAFIAVLPHALPLFTNLPSSMGIGGTGIIIVVGVAMETVKQIEGRLTQKSYRGFLQR